MYCNKLPLSTDSRRLNCEEMLYAACILLQYMLEMNQHAGAAGSFPAMYCNVWQVSANSRSLDLGEML